MHTEMWEHEATSRNVATLKARAVVFVGPATGTNDIPRIGGSGELTPLYLLMEIEGLAPNQLSSRLRKMVGR